MLVSPHSFPSTRTPLLSSSPTGDIWSDNGLISLLRCGRALGPNGDKSHHLKPPDPDPDKDPELDLHQEDKEAWRDILYDKFPETIDECPTSPGGSVMIPVLPPFLQRQIEAEAERQLAAEAAEREGQAAAAEMRELTANESQGGSRASTPSID